MDSARIRELGWEPKVQLEEGINSVYNWYKNTFKDE
jgi:nucleoside-diphosphate-sugar epimerase